MSTATSANSTAFGPAVTRARMHEVKAHLSVASESLDACEHDMAAYALVKAVTLLSEIVESQDQHIGMVRNRLDWKEFTS